MKAPEPKAVTTSQVCSVCGEDWAEHPENPTVLDCITVLKMHRAPRIYVKTYPTINPYYPYPINPTPPYWVTHATTGSGACGYTTTNKLALNSATTN